MLEEFRKGLPGGLGNVILTREKIEAACRRLVHEAKLSKEDAERLADDLYEAGRRQWSDLETMVRKFLRGTLDTLDIGSGSELKTMKKKLEEVEKRVALLESVGHVPREKGKPLE